MLALSRLEAATRDAGCFVLPLRGGLTVQCTRPPASVTVKINLWWRRVIAALDRLKAAI